MATWFPAGLPRTGTMSTYTALEMILPGKCHHMARCNISHFRFILLKYISRVGTDETSRNISFWPKAVAGDVSEVEWRQFIKAERLSAGVDYPISLFWKDLVKIFPNAKVGNSVIRLVWSGRWASRFRKCPLVVSFTSVLNRSVQKSPIQVLLNDRDPVRWYESVKSTILQVVGLVNGPATR